MLKSIGAWIGGNPAFVMLAIVLAAFAMLIVSKNATIAEVRSNSAAKDTRIATLTTAVTTLRNNNTILSKGLDTQNKGIEALKGRADAADATFQQALQRLDAMNAKVGTKVAAIDAAKPGADKCLSAFELMKGAAQ